MGVKKSKKLCPECEARLSRVDFGTRWPARAKAFFLAALGVAVVWAPLVFVVGFQVLDFESGRGRGGPRKLVVMALVAFAPSLGIAGFAGRREGFAQCRQCGWSGAPGDVISA